MWREMAGQAQFERKPKANTTEVASRGLRNFRRRRFPMSTAAGFGTLTFTGGCLHEPRAVPEHPLERQMSKRKPAKASTRARSPKPKTAAKAQRANQAVVRSPKPGRLRSAAAGSSASRSKHHNVSNQEVPVVENMTSLPIADKMAAVLRSEEHTSELQSQS